MQPKVTICVPNLNTLPYLAERFETIFEQTLGDWEMLVYDSYSNDGAWEYIQDVASKDDRIRAWQGPKEGTPGSWTPCLKEARGEYVYIATSDDTMAPDMLEKMVGALDANPDCGLAHCNLRAIDENGEMTRNNEWWRSDSLFARSSGELIDQPHIRRAPYDGLLHCLGATVYISITQLLIRRSLFEEVGYFESTWGAPGDFAWDMRASLLTDTVHVPDTWGGWRLHAAQATDGSVFKTPEYGQKIEGMIDDSLERCLGKLDERVRNLVESGWLARAREERVFQRELTGFEEGTSRRSFIMQRLLSGSSSARHHLLNRALGGEAWGNAAPGKLRELVEQAIGKAALEGLAVTA